MTGQGRPHRWFAACICRRRTIAAAALFALLLAAARDGLAQADAPAPATMRLRITFGGGPARIWTGWVTLSDGQFRNPQLLGLEPDEPGSMAFGVRLIQIHQPSPRSYDGLDIDVTAPLDARLRFRLSPAEAPDEHRTFDMSLADLISGVHPAGGPEASMLDDQGNRLVVSRAPGDRLRVIFQRDSLIFRPGEVFRYSIAPHLTALGRNEDIDLKVRIISRTTGVQHDRKEISTRTREDGSLDEWGPHEFLVPSGDDVFDLVVTIEKPHLLDPLVNANPLAVSKPLLERRVQFVALDAKLQPPRVDAPERLVDELDPVTSDWGERVARWPILKRIPRMKQGKLSHGRTAIAKHLESDWVQMAADAWQAHPLSIDAVGEPHILEVEYPSDIPQTLGISLLEPNALGKVAPLGVDTAVMVDATSARALPKKQTHRLVFWPKTKTPIVLLTSHDAGRSAIYGKIRVYHLGQHLPPASADQIGQDERLVGAWLEKPVFPEMFGAADAADRSTGRNLDDWRTFYEGANRLTQHLRYSGYNAAVVPALCEGSSLYPSALLEPTPKYDTGIYLSQGSDPQRKDVLELLLRMFDRQHLTLLPSLQFNTPLPELEALRNGDPRNRTGVELINHQGRTWLARHGAKNGLAPYYNPLDDRVQTAMVAVVSEMAQRYGRHSALGGIVIEMSPQGYAMLPGGDWGFDDRTFAEFTAAVEVADPGAGRDRFAERAAWCRTTGRTQWLTWRAEKLSKLYGRMATELRRVNPEARLILAGSDMLSGDALRRLARPRLNSKPPTESQIQEALLELGLNPELLTGQPGIVLVAPYPELSQQVSGNHPPIDRDVAALLRDQLAASGFLTFRPPVTKRVETFDAVSPFGPSSTYTWLAAQVAPSGDANRRRLSECLAQQDAQIYFDGGWMFSRGQEEALRESLSALRKLPRMPLKAPAETRQQSPLTLRTAARQNETIACLVNNSPWPVSARVNVAAGGRWSVRTAKDEIDEVAADGGPTWTVTLPPYGIVTGVFDRADVQLSIADAELPDLLREEVSRRLQDVQRRATALKNPKSVAAQNLNFDQPPGPDGAIPGWVHAHGEGGKVSLVEGGFNKSAQALRLVSQGPEVWARSQPIKTPKTGRITVWARLRMPEGNPQPELRLAIEARRDGKPYYRFANVGAGSPEAAIGSEWAPFILQIDDLPLQGLDEFRIGFDLMSEGEVWIDDVVVYDLSFSQSEQFQISRLIAAADFHLRAKNTAAAAEVLNGYWPSFLEQHVDPLEQEIVDTPRRPVGPARDETPADEPPLRQSFLNRAKGWWPF